MTPDERLREAVGEYLRALADTEYDVSWKALCRLRAVYNEDPRPCINAAVEVERKPWWRFW